MKIKNFHRYIIAIVLLAFAVFILFVKFGDTLWLPILSFWTVFGLVIGSLFFYYYKRSIVSAINIANFTGADRDIFKEWRKQKLFSINLVLMGIPLVFVSMVFLDFYINILFFLFIWVSSIVISIAIDIDSKKYLRQMSVRMEDVIKDLKSQKNVSLSDHSNNKTENTGNFDENSAKKNIRDYLNKNFPNYAFGDLLESLQEAGYEKDDIDEVFLEIKSKNKKIYSASSYVAVSILSVIVSAFAYFISVRLLLSASTCTGSMTCGMGEGFLALFVITPPVFFLTFRLLLKSARKSVI